MKIPFIIISAELSHHDGKTNMKRTNTLKELIKGTHMPYKEILGLYAGKAESSFLLPLDTLYKIREKQIEKIQNLANDFGQESVLVRHCDNSCQLLFNTGDTVEIGQWNEVDKMPLDFGTYDPATKKYYATTGVA